MKLCSFHAAGRDRIGFEVREGAICDLEHVWRQAGIPDAAAPRSLIDLIAAGPDVWDAALRAAAIIAESNVPSFATDAVQWHAPVRTPSKICCIALNNSANKDRILSGPTHPAMFVKPASALIGHLDDIVCRPHYGRTHPEPELAVVIGRRAKDVVAERAYDHVFGYTIHNDITSPTMRAEDTFHYRAIHPVEGDPTATRYVDTWVSYPGRYKCADTFACLGPWLVTAADIPHPHDLSVACLHQGKEITSDNTGNLFYKIPEVIAFLSGYMTLLPGDVVSMGTALNKAAQGGAVQNIDLNKLGGPISVSIERIGTLTNGVRRTA
jgi:2-keto-4-pentenoate hydratase/2-oxohepta-3-ene-1,7-dioic acid hydratase in catechol pathway